MHIKKIKFKLSLLQKNVATTKACSPLFIFIKQLFTFIVRHLLL